MNLITDIGNTTTKIAVFGGRKKITSERYEGTGNYPVERLLASYSIDNAIVSSVRDLPASFTDLLNRNVASVHVLSYKSDLPFVTGYLTPESLGTDRIAAIAGAHMHNKGNDTLVIDAGTAITYDLLTGNCYPGGNISPGIEMRFRALNSFTGKLPLITERTDFSSPGRDTVEAITAGVIKGVIYEINEYIRTFEEKYAGIRVILTGGDGSFLHDKLDHKTEYLPEIVIEGLNYILEYNAK